MAGSLCWGSAECCRGGEQEHSPTGKLGVVAQEDVQEFEASPACGVRRLVQPASRGARSVKCFEWLVSGPKARLPTQDCALWCLVLARPRPAPHPQWKPSPSAPRLGNQCSWVTYLDGCYGDDVDSFMWHKRRARFAISSLRETGCLCHVPVSAWDGEGAQTACPAHSLPTEEPRPAAEVCLSP